MTEALETTTRATQLLAEEDVAYITAAAELGSQFIAATREAQARFAALHDQQADVLDILQVNPAGGNYHYFYRKGEYDSNSGLDFRAYIESVINQFLSTSVRYINQSYELNFSPVEAGMVEAWMQDGINVNHLWDALDEYLDGRTFAEVKVDEAVEAFAGLIGRYHPLEHIDGPPRYAYVHLENTSLIVDHFYQENWMGRISFETQNKLHTLRRYLTDVVGEEIYTLNDLDVGNAYVPPADQNSSIKSIRMFKNGKLKVTFHSVPDLYKAVTPVFNHCQGK